MIEYRFDSPLEGEHCMIYSLSQFLFFFGLLREDHRRLFEPFNRVFRLAFCILTNRLGRKDPISM